jgi:hypothetical protein
MTERIHTGTHRLTDLPGEKHPQKCQICGQFDPLEGIKIGRGILNRWQEHDHNDRKEHRVIVLCGTCSKRVIKPHPRLYEALQPAQPFPGCMALCLDCKFRYGVSCTHPEAKANGGNGVILTVEKPIMAMVDGRNYSGPLALWKSPATACKQKES